ncbi:MAG: hypothetical protein K6E19_07920 [Lachnospiraceae bacterium]|nr:hypothetical protein [Lachnospiraceae bacterium]
MISRMNLKKNLAFAMKVLLAAVVAIIVADLFKLRFSVSAGIVAILSVAYTKRETVKTAVNRFLAFIAALLIAAACFNLIGYTVYGFFVYLALFIILCVLCGWNSAMAMDSVLISHFLTFEAMDIPALSNELGLFVIGVGCGMVANIFLHSDKAYMDRMKKETDDLIKQALHRMSLRIIDPDMPGYDGSCFDKLRETLDEAAAMARTNHMNELGGGSVSDIEYIAMREAQADTLFEIYKHLSKIETVPITAGILSAFFEKVSAEYSMDNTVEGLLKDFSELDREMKDKPLPTDRKEFEDRARLFAIMRGLEDFLNIKKDYINAKRN